MPDILRQETSMETLSAKDGTTIQSDHVYVVPPNKNLYVAKRTLRLIQKPHHPYVAHSIDLFFRSMAESLKDEAIGIVLSGAGSDGTFGARLINQRLGLVMVRDPATAEVRGMPDSAILSDAADYILPPEKMPASLSDYVKNFYGKPSKERWERLTPQKCDMTEIFALVKALTGLDLSIYKLSPTHRRIDRRMGIHGLKKIEDYVQLLRTNPMEVQALSKFFLISITRFFQEPKSYAILKAHLKELIRNKSARSRSSSPCSTALSIRRASCSRARLTIWTDSATFSGRSMNNGGFTSARARREHRPGMVRPGGLP